MKILEKISMVAVLCAAVLLSVVLIKDHLLSKQTMQPAQAALSESAIKGQTINLPGVDWNGDAPTLVASLSTSCHFCTESTSFYKKLLAARQLHEANFRFLTLFPQEKADAVDYLKRQNLISDAVLTADLTSLDVTGTPTLLLIDSRGVVQKVWVGKLSETDEKDVLSKLSVKL